MLVLGSHGPFNQAKNTNVKKLGGRILGAVFALVTTLFFTNFPASEAKFCDCVHNFFFTLLFLCRTDNVDKCHELSQFICERSAPLTTFFDRDQTV